MPHRFIFVLLGIAFAIASVAIITVLGFCLYHSTDIMAGRYKCDANNRVFELVVTMMSTAVALYFGTKK